MWTNQYRDQYAEDTGTPTGLEIRCLNDIRKKK